MRKKNLTLFLIIIFILVNILLLRIYASKTNLIIFILWAGILTNLLFGLFNAALVRNREWDKRRFTLFASIASVVESVIVFFTVYHDNEIVNRIIENTEKINSESISFSDLGTSGIAPSLFMGCIVIVFFSVLGNNLIEEGKNV